MKASKKARSQSAELHKSAASVAAALAKDLGTDADFIGKADPVERLILLSRQWTDLQSETHTAARLEHIAQQIEELRERRLDFQQENAASNLDEEWERVAAEWAE
jgi:hypothetical protein